MKENKPTPINIDLIDLDELKKKVTDLPGLIEYAHHIGGFSIAPTKQEAIKHRALQAMQEQTQSQLDQILEQMKILAKQASDLKYRVDVSQQIYRSHISFKPIIGETYYLYEKSNGEHTLSLVSPEEWGNEFPFKTFIAKVKLLADHTWKVFNNLETSNE